MKINYTSAKQEFNCHILFRLVNVRTKHHSTPLMQYNKIHFIFGTLVACHLGGLNVTASDIQRGDVHGNDEYITRLCGMYTLTIVTRK